MTLARYNILVRGYCHIKHRNKMNKEIAIKITSPDHNNAVQTALFLLGYKWMNGAKFQYEEAVAIVGYKDNDLGYASENTDATFKNREVLTLDDLYDRMINKVVKVELNESYNAIIYKDRVTVGCQEFDNCTIENFVDAWLNFHEK